MLWQGQAVLSVLQLTQTADGLPITLHCVWYHLLYSHNSCVNWRDGRARGKRAKSVAQLGQIMSERAQHVGLPEIKHLLWMAAFGRGECPFLSIPTGRHISGGAFPVWMVAVGPGSRSGVGWGATCGASWEDTGPAPSNRRDRVCLFGACNCFGQTATCLCLAGFQLIKGLGMCVCLVVLLCTLGRNGKFLETVGWKEWK